MQARARGVLQEDRESERRRGPRGPRPPGSRPALRRRCARARAARLDLPGQPPRWLASRSTTSRWRTPPPFRPGCLVPAPLRRSGPSTPRSLARLSALARVLRRRLRAGRLSIRFLEIFLVRADGPAGARGLSRSFEPLRGDSRGTRRLSPAPPMFPRDRDGSWQRDPGRRMPSAGRPTSSGRGRVRATPARLSDSARGRADSPPQTCRVGRAASTLPRGGSTNAGLRRRGRSI